MIETLMLVVGASLLLVLLVGIAIWIALTSTGERIWSERRQAIHNRSLTTFV